MLPVHCVHCRIILWFASRYHERFAQIKIWAAKYDNNNYHKLKIKHRTALLDQLNARFMLISYHGQLLNRARSNVS